jgi:hypothetical protein
MNQFDKKNWAQQIVKTSLQEILAGNFQIPSQEEMETFIRCIQNCLRLKNG